MAFAADMALLSLRAPSTAAPLPRTASASPETSPSRTLPPWGVEVDRSSQPLSPMTDTADTHLPSIRNSTALASGTYDRFWRVHTDRNEVLVKTRPGVLLRNT